MLLAFSAVLAAIGLNEIVSHLVPAADASRSVILLVGMAVGVDYSLFYLRREREERAGGLEPAAALERAAATSGLAVLISGGTVLIAMAGMFFAGHGIFTSIALGAMIVVSVAMVGSLSVLPALLHKLGDKVERGRIPFIGRLRKPAGDSRLWGAILRPVLRRPASRSSSAVGRSCSRPRRCSACTRSCRASPTFRTACRSSGATSTSSRRSRAPRRRPWSSSRPST